MLNKAFTNLPCTVVLYIRFCSHKTRFQPVLKLFYTRCGSNLYIALWAVGMRRMAFVVVCMRLQALVCIVVDISNCVEWRFSVLGMRL